LIGANETLSTVRKGLSPKQLTSESGNGGGQGSQKLLGSDAKGRNDQSATRQTQGMDTTLQATTDMGGGQREPEDE
jgi:hypothetical protein